MNVHFLTGLLNMPKEDFIVTPPDDPRSTLALDRTVLANERTCAAWIRTGLAALATGMGTAKFMGDLLHTWSIRLITVTLIAFSAIAFVVAAWRYRHLHLRITHLDLDTVPSSLINTLSALLIVCSLIALINLWLTSM